MAAVGTSPWGRAARLAHSLAPLLIAVPVAVALATMLGRIVGVDHPDLNFTAAVNGDAEAFYLGEAIDRDPADGYTGQLYTPLFPFLVSLLHRVHLWGGWLLVVNYGATLALVGLVAAVAYDRRAGGWDRVLAGVGALGMGLFAWWLVSVIPLNLLFDGRSDHTAWALALFALVLLGSRADPSARRLALVVALLSAAFWAKQTAAVASAAAVAWMLAGAALGVHRLRTALAFCAGLLLVNLAVLGLLNAATGGWEFRLDFELAQEHPQFAEFWPSARELARYATPALAFPAVIAAAIALKARPWQRPARTTAAGARSRAGAALRGSPDGRLAVLFVLFVIVGFPAAVYFRLKVGSEVNQYVGVLWGTGVLAALAWRRAGAHPATAVLAAAAVGVLFLAAHRPGESYRGFYLPPPERTQEYAEVSPELLAYARTHLVWQQVQSDLNVQPQGEIYPNFYNFVDLLAAGEQPRYLVRALLDRHFDAVAPIRFGSPQESLFWEIYSSGSGRRESAYFWKLNRVIASGYAPAPGAPEHFLVRRAGPPEHPWMRGCFGPFRAAGVDFGIRAGGGFWCRDGAGALRLRETPAAVSEVHALDAVDSVRGVLTLRAGGPVTVSLTGDHGRGWALTLRPARGAGARLQAGVDGHPLGRGLELAGAAARGVTIRFARGGGAPGIEASGGEVVARLPDAAGGDLSVRAARGSDARVALDGLELNR